MCLSTISTAKPEPTGFGYKVVIPLRHADQFIPSVAGGVRYRVGRWNTAVPTETFLDGGFISSQKYTVGFHIFVRRKDAKTYQRQFPREVVVKVEYRKARLLGTGSDFSDKYTLVPQVVADEMRIVEVVKPGRKGKR